MKSHAFSVYDEKSESYGTPFFAPTVGHALRSFCDACADPNVVFSKHPEDFTLYQVGTFDDEKGVLSPVAPLKNLGKGVDFIQKLK